MTDTAAEGTDDGGAGDGPDAPGGTAGGLLARLRTPEVERRFVHMTGALAPASYLLGVLSWRQLGIALLGCSLLAAALEIARLSGALDLAIYDRLTREYEQDNPAGYALYMYSMAAVALVFSSPVAVAGMLMLAVGDPISGLMGSAGVGEIKGVTTLAAMFGVCLALALGTFAVAGVGLSSAGVAAGVAGAAGATVADGVKPVVAGYVVDDNLSIPPVACGAMWVVLWLVR
jgi:dolichol kinase